MQNNTGNVEALGDYIAKQFHLIEIILCNLLMQSRAENLNKSSLQIVWSEHSLMRAQTQKKKPYHYMAYDILIIDRQYRPYNFL